MQFSCFPNTRHRSLFIFSWSFLSTSTSFLSRTDSPFLVSYLPALPTALVFEIRKLWQTLSKPRHYEHCKSRAAGEHCRRVICLNILSPRAWPIHLATEQDSNNRHKDTQEINVHKTKINPSLVIILIQELNWEMINEDCFHSWVKRKI